LNQPEIIYFKDKLKWIPVAGRVIHLNISMIYFSSQLLFHDLYPRSGAVSQEAPSPRRPIGEHDDIWPHSEKTARQRLTPGAASNVFVSAS